MRFAPLRIPPEVRPGIRRSVGKSYGCNILSRRLARPAGLDACPPGRIRGLTRVGDEVVAALDTGELVGFRPGERQVAWIQPLSRAGLGPPADAGQGEALVVDRDGGGCS